MVRVLLYRCINEVLRTMSAIHAIDGARHVSPRPIGRPGFPRCVAAPPRGVGRAAEDALDALHTALLHDGALLMRDVDVTDASAFTELAERLGGPIAPVTVGARSDARFLFALGLSAAPSVRETTIVDGRRVLGDLDEGRVGRLLDEPLCVRVDARSEWVTSAIRFHPITHEPAFGCRELAFDEGRVRYVDGSPIEAGALAHLRAAVARHAWVHRWRRGDLLVIDRSLVLYDGPIVRGGAGIVVAESGARV